MTDIATQAAKNVTEGEAAEAAKAPQPAKIVAQPHNCLCQSYELVGKEDQDEVFQTECGQTTKSTFAQGHDARLVSFLVDGHFDGYAIRQTVNGKATSFATPAEAVAHVSEALKGKAEKATTNRSEKDAAKKAAKDERESKKAVRQADAAKKKADAAAAKEAAKADKAKAPKAVGAQVVAGSREGTEPQLAEGQAVIKVGKFEFVAQVAEDGTATYIDGSGAEQTRERDGYQLLRSYEAPAA